MKKLTWTLYVAAFAAFYSCNTPKTTPQPEAKATIVTLKKESAEKALANDFKIYNDPHLRKITVEFTSGEDASGLLNVFASDGKLVSRQVVSVVKGINRWEYVFSAHSAGTYWVWFTTSAVERKEQVFKKCR